MTKFALAAVTAVSMLAWAQPSFAQVDEIVVTGSRIIRTSATEAEKTPGVSVIKRGDFLLLEATIESDARELTTRLEEIAETIDAFLEAAKDDSTIELSIIESNARVQRLNTLNYQGGVMRGARPDTSISRIRVKTAIPDQVENSAKLSSKLSRFVDSIDETGRITISTAGNTAVSIVDPFQYRDEVVAAIVEEVNAVTDALGPEYVAMIKGLDRQVYWERQGDIDLAFSLPYSYDIIPNTLHSVESYD